MIKGHKFFNRAIAKISDLEKAEKEINSIISSKNRQIRMGQEITIEMIEFMAELIESTEQGIIKSIQEQYE